MNTQTLEKRPLPRAFEIKEGAAAKPKADESTVAKAVDGLMSAFEEFKSANDKRLKEIEKKGSADVITTEKVDRINDALSEREDVIKDLKKQVEDLETKTNRPGFGTKGGALTSEEVEYKQTFETFLRTGEGKSELKKLEKTILTQKNLDKKAGSTTTSGWGNAIPEDLSRVIEDRLIDVSETRDLVTTETRGSTDITDMFNTRGATSGWRGEGGAVVETDTPSLVPVSYTHGMLYALPTTTEESLDDLFFNVGSWLIDNVVDDFDREEGEALLTGDGVNKPTGLLTAPNAATADSVRAFGTFQFVATGVAASLGVTPLDTLIDIETETRKPYRRNANWVMNRRTLSVYRKIKDADGRYIWSAGDASEGVKPMLMGYPYVELEDMPDIAANSLPLAFGDFKRGYKMFPIVGMRMTRDDVTSKGNVVFYIRRRMAGGPFDTDAIKFLKVSL